MEVEEEQAEFKPERQTNESIYIIKNFIERIMDTGEKSY